MNGVNVQIRSAGVHQVHLQRFCRLPQGDLHRLRAAVRLDDDALRLDLRVVLCAENDFVFSVRIRLERQNVFSFRQIKR